MLLSHMEMNLSRLFSLTLLCLAVVVAVIGNEKPSPLKLIRVLQANGLLAETPPELLVSFDRILREIY